MSGLDKSDPTTNANFVESVLGVRPQANDFVGSRVKTSWIENHFREVPVNISEANLWPYVQAYLLAIICNIIDLGMAASTCNIMYLRLLIDIETINNFA